MTSPYAPPPNTSLIQDNSAVANSDTYGNPLPQLLPAPRSCRAGAGTSWLTRAFTMFKDNFLLWLGISVAFVLIMILSNLLPIIGSLVGFVTFIFIGGLMQGCAAQARGGELRFDHLFAGFKRHFVPLLILSVLYFVGFLIAFIPLFAVLGSMVFSMISGDATALSYGMSNASVLGMMLAYLLSLALLVPVFMAVWFAPSLIVLHDVDVVTAMKMSFKGCMKNMLPMLVFGLVALFLIPIVVIFTLGLGLFIVIPIMMITYYTSYRDVWTDQPISVM